MCETLQGTIGHEDTGVGGTGPLSASRHLVLRTPSPPSSSPPRTVTRQQKEGRAGHTRARVLAFVCHLRVPLSSYARYESEQEKPDREALKDERGKQRESSISPASQRFRLCAAGVKAPHLELMLYTHQARRGRGWGCDAASFLFSSFF